MREKLKRYEADGLETTSNSPQSENVVLRVVNQIGKNSASKALFFIVLCLAAIVRSYQYSSDWNELSVFTVFLLGYWVRVLLDRLGQSDD